MATQEGIMELIYNKINDLIGAGNQLFTMQFPAQPLNYRMYQYDTSSNTSVLTKPFSVAENEFRLSDQLFDVSPITAGSNGERLSVVYNTLINNFIPKLDYLIPFIRDRAGLGNFLEEDSGERDATGKKLSRIELCKILYLEYLNAKNEWNEIKTEKYDNLKEDYRKAQTDYETARDRGVLGAELKRLERAAADKSGWLDNYAKWQSSEGAVGQEKLNNLYNDVVVRGKLHEILTILGYLNASSVAEELELTKQRMRNSSRSSLDESMTIYPVQFQPNNWFKALAPNLNPEDLTMAQDSIRDQLIAKRRELSRAKSDLAKMDLMDVTPDQIADIQKKVDQKQVELRAKERELNEAHGKAIVDLAKMFVKTGSGEKTTSSETASKAKGLGMSLSDDDVKKIEKAVEGIVATKQLQEETTSALAELQTLKAKRAQLESRDWKFNKSSLQQRVQELTVEVDYYAELFSDVKVSREQHKTSSFDGKLEVVNSLVRSVNTAIESLQQLKNNPPADLTSSGGSLANLVLPTARLSEYSVNSTLAKKSDEAKLESLNNRYELTIEPEAVKIVTALEEAIKVFVSAGLEDKSDNLSAQRNNIQADQTSLAATAPPVLSTSRTEADAEISGMFQEILIKSSRSTQSSAQTETAAASQRKWSVSGWFFSASGQSSTSSSSSAQESSFFNQDIEIGFRVAKVSFDRGGWFNPAIFRMSHAFYHLAPIKVSGGLDIKDIKNPQTGELERKSKWIDGQDNNSEQQYVLPAFPVAMAIAKDITIKVKTASGESKSSKSVVESSLASSGGFLGFSASSGSSSRNSSEAAFHGATSDAYYIRIPGPQVIGYFLQLVPKDNSHPYSPVTKMTENGKESEVIEAFKLYKSPSRFQESKEKMVLDTSPEISTIAPAKPKI